MRFRIRKLLVFLMMFLFIGTSNHCFFEDLFRSISSNLWGNELLDIPCLDHGDKESSESHEHGENHSILAIDNLKSQSDFYKIFAVVPLIFISKFSLSVFFYGTLQSKIFPIDHAFSPRFLKQFITSLTLASQAPPSLL